MTKWGPRLFFIAIGIFTAGFFYLAFLQYLGWREAGPPAQYLVPPYRSAGYLFSYVISHHLFNYFISLGVAFIFLGVAILMNEKSGGIFFEKEEPYFGALAIFLLGNPLWLYYLAVILLMAVLGSIIAGHWRKKSERFSLYYFWWPAAVLVFIGSKIIGWLL